MNNHENVLPDPDDDDLFFFPFDACGAFLMALSVSHTARKRPSRGRATIDLFTTAGERSGWGLAVAFSQFMPTDELRQYALTVQPPWVGECDGYDWMSELPNAALSFTQWIVDPEGFDLALHLVVDVGSMQVSVVIPPIAAMTTVVVPPPGVRVTECLELAPDCSTRKVPPATVLGAVRSACTKAEHETEFDLYPVLPWLATLIRNDIDRSWKTPAA